MAAEDPSGVDGPLRGVRILDLTHVWAGPLAVRMLSDLGAEVIKIEAPYGRGPQQLPYQPIGGWLGGAPGEQPWNNSALFVKLHRNRRSLCLDLKQDDGRQLLLQLVRQADVVIENFSANAMGSMGLGYELLQEANPNIIYVTMPGYGSSGPYSKRVAFGPVVEPMSGLTAMLGYAADEPRNSALAVMDPVGGTHAVAAVVAALRRRAQTGVGARVELSLHEGGVSFSGPWLIDQQLGHAPQCVGNRHPQMAPHGVYPCRGTDQWLALACENDQQWAALYLILQETDGAHALGADWSFGQRQRRADKIDQCISMWTSRLNKEVAADLLQQRGIPAGPVNTTPDMVADPQVQAREFFVPYERFDTPMPGNPMHMPGLDSGQWRPCPALGEHNREVLQEWLALSDEAVDALQSQGVLLDRPPD